MANGKTGSADQALSHYYNGALAATPQTMFIGQGNLFGIEFENNAAAADVFIQFYDALVGNVTVGTTVPDFTFRIPAGTNYGKDAQQFCTHWFAIGCVVACTSTRTGAGAPSSPVSTNCWYWKQI